MKSDNHDKRMADVCSHIYGAFYDFEPQSMERAHAMIEKNPDELGVALDIYEASQTSLRASNATERQNHERMQAILAGVIGKHTA